MNTILLIHILASFFTVVFVIYTSYQVFHRYSLQHRINKLSSRIKPLMLGKNSREHIINIMTLDGFQKKEVEEMYDIIHKEVEARRNLKH